MSRAKRPKFQWILVAGLACVAVILAIDVFGSDLRLLFSTSTDSLSGARASTGFRRKTLHDFGRADDGRVVEYGSFDGVSATNRFRSAGVNPAVTASEDRLSTFAVDVDTASYTLARRELLEGLLPDPDGVRVEEFVNAFAYDYPAPEHEPLGVTLDAAPSPLDAEKTLLRVGLKARKIPISQRKTAHLVFLVDVSGSMASVDRLPLAKQAMHLLVDNLRDGDTVAIVTYAGDVREVLPPSGLESVALVHEAIDSLRAGGGTRMGDGLGLAYRLAARTLENGSISRVIVMSDGDANLGPGTPEELRAVIAGHVKEGVTLTTCGFGLGNYRDDVMETLADRGNGASYYVDSLATARRLFQEQLAGTLELVAQDVKVQVEFDPAAVRTYRLLGYENRAVADRDFRNDAVDAGDVGSGHAVTALYELVLTGAPSERLATVRVRAKEPRGRTAAERVFTLSSAKKARSFESAPADFRFAVAVATFAEKLRGSPFAAPIAFGEIGRLAQDAANTPERREFLSLVERARALQPRYAAVR